MKGHEIIHCIQSPVSIFHKDAMHALFPACFMSEYTGEHIV